MIHSQTFSQNYSISISTAWIMQNYSKESFLASIFKTKGESCPDHIQRLLGSFFRATPRNIDAKVNDECKTTI
jgi:hypothetical protein